MFGPTRLVLAFRTDYRANCYIAEKYQFDTFNKVVLKYIFILMAINGNNTIGCNPISLHAYFNAFVLIFFLI